jgi:hypothetical protein
MDAWVAEYIFHLNVKKGPDVPSLAIGEKVVVIGKATYWNQKSGDLQPVCWHSISPYSTEISAAWEVVENMKPLSVRIYSREDCAEADFFNKHCFYEAEIMINEGYVQTGTKHATVPLAICRAALLTKFKLCFC